LHPQLKRHSCSTGPSSMVIPDPDSEVLQTHPCFKCQSYCPCMLAPPQALNSSHSAHPAYSPQLQHHSVSTHSFIFFSFIHMCIQCLGHFSPLSPAPSLSSPPPCYQAETILPLSLILLMREYKQ
jgi:hypothetical protein